MPSRSDAARPATHDGAPVLGVTTARARRPPSRRTRCPLLAQERRARARPARRGGTRGRTRARRRRRRRRGSGSERRGRSPAGRAGSRCRRAARGGRTPGGGPVSGSRRAPPAAAGRFGVAPDLRELVVVERARLAEDLQRHRQLADVVQQAADGEVAAQRGGQLELLADAGGEQRDAARVLGGGRVPLGQPDQQRAHARAEEGLRGGDQLGRRQVAHERARRAAAREVEHGRDADQRDPAELHRVAAVEGRRCRTDSSWAYSDTPSHAQPAATSRSAGRRVSACVRTARCTSTARQSRPKTSSAMAGGLPAFGTVGTSDGRRARWRRAPSTPIASTAWRTSSGRDPARLAQRRQRGQCEQRGTDRQRRPPAARSRRSSRPRRPGWRSRARPAAPSSSRTRCRAGRRGRPRPVRRRREPDRDARGGARGDQHGPEVCLGGELDRCTRRLERQREQGHGRGKGREEVTEYRSGGAICRASQRVSALWHRI